MPYKERRSESRAGGHAPFWPPVYSHLRAHKLCFVCPLGDGLYRLWWEDGSKSQTFATYDEWKALLSAHGVGIDCFVGELGIDGTGFPWIQDAIADPHAKVKCSKTGGVTSLHMRCGRLHLAVGSLSSWVQNWSTIEPLELLNSIRCICEVTRTGSCLSPGSLGTNVLHRNWKGSAPTYPKVSRCNLRLLELLKEFAIAGRVETFTDRRVMFSIELDMRSAYASCCAEIPWGTPRRIASKRSPAECSARYATWFARCVVTITTKLPISPIPLRVRGRWTWVTKPGVYTTWLWREEVEAAIRARIYIEVQEGWGWKSLSNRLQPWVEEMESYRSYFESCERFDIGGMVKRCTVSAIGWLGCSLLRYALEAAYQKGNIPLVNSKGNAPISRYTLHPSEDEGAGAPNHLHTYIMMRCRLRVYERELEELWDGNELLGVNFDAIYVVRPSIRPIGRGMGQWKQEPRHAASEEGLFPRARWLNSEERLSLPGLRRDSPLRAKYQDASSAARRRAIGVRAVVSDTSATTALSTEVVDLAP